MISLPISLRSAMLVLVAVPVMVACTSDPTAEANATTTSTTFADGYRDVAVIDSLMPDMNEAVGTAAPLLNSTLSTKLMATVTAVHVQEGDAVTQGQLLVSLDVRDVEARSAQASGGLAAAQAMLADAEVQTARLRALFADSAAPKAQLDAAEAGLARAQAAVVSARGGVAETAAVREYGSVRAPFNGVISQRLVDPGAFAAPGAPLIMILQAGTLRVNALIPPDAARSLTRGTTISVAIEGTETTGTVEGVVATPSGGLFTVNVLVKNANGALPTGGSATLRLPGGTRTVRLAPGAAVVREGDLTGLQVRANGVVERRWVRTGRSYGDWVEVLSGVNVGDVVLVPETPSPLERGASTERS
jgi:RND family efflux transporter MFP subunit